MSKFVRAFDITLTVRIDGVPQVPMQVNSGSFNRGHSMEEIPIAGKDVPVVDGINGVKSLTLDVNTRAWLHDLFDAQELQNRGDAEVFIEAEFSLDVGGGNVVTYLLPDCIAHEPGTTIGTGTDRVTDTVTLTSDVALRR